MSQVARALALWALCSFTVQAQDVSVQPQAREIESACDSIGFLEAAIKAEELRKGRRLSAEQFARMASEPDTIVLDARGKSAYENLHVKGSINLPYTEFSEASLKQAIPEKSTRILLYCRNNLLSLPIGMKNTFSSASTPGPTLDLEFKKATSAGLNVPTYITLYIYGYPNVWELSPAVDPSDSPIHFVRPWQRATDETSCKPASP